MKPNKNLMKKIYKHTIYIQYVKNGQMCDTFGGKSKANVSLSWHNNLSHLHDKHASLYFCKSLQNGASSCGAAVVSKPPAN